MLSFLSSGLATAPCPKSASLTSASPMSAVFTCPSIMSAEPIVFAAQAAPPPRAKKSATKAIRLWRT
jgi:hypothetical protein